jgi:hypothetical protein
MNERARLGKLCAGVLAAGLLSGCIAVGTPYPPNIGGEKVTKPSAANFRGRPVVKVTFISTTDSSTENTFYSDYIKTPIRTSAPPNPNDSGLVETDHEEVTDDQIATNNMRAMFAKNTFYALHLAKYLRLRSKGDLAVILNPTTLVFEPGKGYRLEPFEKGMPAHDVEINILTYVHPNTRPSNKSSLITSYGESLAPIISVRVDPAVKPDTGGAVALTSELVNAANNPDGEGLRAQLIDMLNTSHYAQSAASASLQGKSLGSGALEKGKYFELDAGSHDLEKTPIPETLIPAKELAAANYSPGAFFAYEFYDAYYKMILAALGLVDNNKVVTTAQKKYWAALDSADLSDVMLKNTDQGKKTFLLKAKETEVRYLEDRDQRWTAALFETNDFLGSFNNLRDSEQEARNQYIQAQTQAVIGALIAIGGAVAAARSGSSDNTAGTIGGVALIGVGAALIARAASDLETIDVTFKTSFESAYDSQKSYVFEISESERVEVRAKSYDEFKKFVKEQYDRRFGPNRTEPVS